MKGLRVVIRRLVADTAPRTVSRSSSISESLVLSSAAAYSALLFAEDKSSPRFISSIAPGGAFNYQAAVQNHFRSFSSSSSADPSNIVSIESKEQFTDSLRKVQDESLPAIFYFTAVWCGPCRLLSPVIGQLSEKYPHVTTYKIDIDNVNFTQKLSSFPEPTYLEEELGNELSKLNIHSVPTLLFFLNGKKASEVIGADLQRLKDTMEALYK